MRRKALVTGAVALGVLVACSGSRSVVPTSPPASLGPAGTIVAVHGIVVSLCEECVRAAERTDVNIEILVRRTLARVAALFPDLHTTVTVTVTLSPSKVIPDVGVGGKTNARTGNVSIWLNPASADLRSALAVWVPATLAHELAHAERVMHGPGYGHTLLEVLVSEGLADAVENQVLGGPLPSVPGYEPSTRKEILHVWREAEPKLDQPMDAQAWSQWFGWGADLPAYAGYDLGDKLVSSYLNSHPGQTAAELTGVDAHRILGGSRFGR